MGRSIVICFTFLLIGQCCLAQFTYKVDRRHTNFTLGYQAALDLNANRQLFQHGGTFSTAISLANKNREKQQTKTGYNRIIDRDIYLKVNLSTYKRVNIHHALMINAGPAFRVTLPEGIFFEFEGTVGYLRTFLSGDHFVFDGSTVQNAKALGNNLFSIHAMSSFGWNFQKSHQYPVYIYSNIGLMTYFPNNGSWVLQPVFGGGLGFVLTRIKETYE